MMEIGNFLQQAREKFLTISKGQVPFYYLFPTTIWSEISFFIPEKFFQLCEEFQLPYHYASSICVEWNKDCQAKLTKRYTNHFLRYSKLRCLSSASPSCLIKLPSRLCTLTLNDYDKSLEPLEVCENLLELCLDNFDGEAYSGLESLKKLKNLRTI